MIRSPHASTLGARCTLVALVTLALLVTAGCGTESGASGVSTEPASSPTKQPAAPTSAPPPFLAAPKPNDPGYTAPKKTAPSNPLSTSTLSTSNLEPGSGGVRFDPPAIEIGAVGHRQKVPFEWKFTNGTGDKIDVLKVSESCGCLSSEDLRLTLQPGESATGRTVLSVGTNFGSMQKYVLVTIRHVATSRNETLKLPIRWKCHPGLVRPKPGSFSLTGAVGTVTEEGESQVTLKRVKRTGTPLQLEELRADGLSKSAGQFDVTQESRPDEVTLTVRLRPTHPESRVSGYVKAKVDGLPIVIPVRGQVYRGLRTDPNYFQFGQIRNPRKAVQTVAVTAVDGVEFDITSIDADPTCVEVEFEPREGGGFIITARPAVPYPDVEKNTTMKCKEVVVTTTHPDKPELRLRVLGIHVPAHQRTGG